MRAPTQRDIFGLFLAIFDGFWEKTVKWRFSPIFVNKNLYQKLVSDINHYMSSVLYDPKYLSVGGYGGTLPGVYTAGTFVVYMN